MSQEIEIREAQKTRPGEGSTRTDQIGKVFIVVGREVRQCLICECVFTRRDASEHAKVVCTSGTPTSCAD
jgi:hypothetical protein